MQAYGGAFICYVFPEEAKKYIDRCMLEEEFRM